MVSALLSRCLILSLGTLYPAYRSYKAIKNKDMREYVKWMMYWIVFALFTTLETMLDIFISWFPFYYEIKILFILWVLSPATHGSSILYKKVVHPLLCSREKDIDEFIEKTKQQGYSTFLQVFQSGFQYASQIFITSALKSHSLIESQLKKSLSLNDVNNSNINNNNSANINAVPTSEVVLRRQATATILEEDSDYNDEIERRRLAEDQEYLAKKTSNEELKKHTKRSSKTSLASSSGSSYKTTEASHYGTITRSKKSSTKGTSSRSKIASSSSSSTRMDENDDY